MSESLSRWAEFRASVAWSLRACLIRPDISVGILIGPENVGRYFEKACRYFDRA